MKFLLISVKLILSLGVFSTAILLASAFKNSDSLFPMRPAEQNRYEAQKPSPTQSATMPDKDKTTNDIPDAIYKDLVARLRVLRASGSLEDLVTEGDNIARQWGANAGRNYGLLFREFLSVLTSPRIINQNSGALELSQKYAVAALKSSEFFDLETEWFLLMYLRYPLQGKILDESGVQQRRERVKLWLHALHRLEREKAKNFNPNDLPALNVEPPKGVNGIAGMSPENIKDPGLRAAYERAIDENKKKVEYFNLQLKLRQNEASMIKNGIEYISTVYAQEPFGLQELDKLLDVYDVSEPLRKNIKNVTEKLIQDK